jgi:hypothetical protein
MKFTPPHWIITVLALLATCGPQIAKAFPNLAPYVSVYDQFVPLILGYLGVTSISALKSKQPTVPPVVGALLMIFLLTGCLSSAPLVPVTPANQAQVSACETTASEHNALLVGDFVLTGGAATLGAIGAVDSSQQAKTDLAIGATAAAGAAVLASSLIALTSSNYASNQCSAVVGPLPTAAPPASAAPGRSTP